MVTKISLSLRRSRSPHTESPGRILAVNTESREKGLGMERRLQWCEKNLYFLSWVVGTGGLFYLFKSLVLLFKNVYIWYSFAWSMYFMRP